MTEKKGYNTTKDFEKITNLQFTARGEGFLRLKLLEKNNVLVVITKNSMYKFKITGSLGVMSVAEVEGKYKKLSNGNKVIVCGSKIYGRLYLGQLVLGAGLILSMEKEGAKAKTVYTSAIDEIRINNEIILPRATKH